MKYRITGSRLKELYIGFSKWTYSLSLIPLLIYLTFQISFILLNLDYGVMPVFKSYVLGFIIFYSFYLMIFAIFKKSKTAVALLSVFFVFLLFLNQFKIHYSLTPILFTDVLFIKDVSSITGIIRGTIFSAFISIIPKILLVSGVMLMIFFLARILSVELRLIKARLGIAAIALVFILVLFIPNPVITRYMKETFFDVEAEKDNKVTSVISYYSKHGFIAGMYGQLICNRFTKPDGYDECIAEIEKELKALESVPCSGEWKKPNIIMIFSESFWDIDQMDDIHFDKPVTANFNALKEKGIFIDMISPSYGGISANVEFEMLTGSSIRYYGSGYGYIPYLQLMTSDYYYNAPSVISVLNDNGYDTTIASTWSDDLYNCGKVYKYFGVKNTFYNRDMKDAELKGGFISEKYVADRIINYMDNKEKDTPAFYMILTTQSHMPYSKDRYCEEEYDISITSKENISDFAADSLRCYAQGLYDADRQLGRLYEYIQSIEEPTIIIFYGDHLPYINEKDGTDAYPSFRYFNTGDPLKDIFRKYNTQCLILGNFDLGKDDIKILGPNLVMPYVLSRTDLNIPAYFKWLAKRKEGLVAGNVFVYSDSNGNLYTKENLPQNLKEDLHRQECLNWKYFVEDR